MHQTQQGAMRLERTRRALAAFDAEDAKPMPEDFTEAWRKLGREDRLARAVGRAYGEDTAHINNLKTCEACVRPGKRLPAGHPDESFVRRMVRLADAV